jgi:hypothetical protein
MALSFSVFSCSWPALGPRAAGSRVRLLYRSDMRAAGPRVQLFFADFSVICIMVGTQGAYPPSPLPLRVATAGRNKERGNYPPPPASDNAKPL